MLVGTRIDRFREMVVDRLAGNHRLETIDTGVTPRGVLNPNATDVFVRTRIGRQRSRAVEIDLTVQVRRDLVASAALHL